MNSLWGTTLIVTSLAFAPAIAEASKEKIRVRLFKQETPVLVRGKNLRVEGRRVSDGSLIITREKNRLWRFEKPGRGGAVARAKININVGRAYAAEEPSTFLGERIRLTGEKLEMRDHEVPGTVEIFQDASGSYNVLAEVDLETYVEGVVAGEVPASWPQEALMAQAVASRSYVLAQKRRSGSATFFTDSSPLHQVYKWMPTKKKSHWWKIVEAVRRTQGMILLDSDKKPLWAYYHADCAGQTEEAHHVWGNKQRFGTTKSCPFEGHEWMARFTLKQLRLGLKLLDQTRLIIKDVGIESFTPSGRVKEIRFVLEDGSVETVTLNQFRQRMGFDRVRSGVFTIRRRGNLVEFLGRGHGHGVGLCQKGTRELALAGKSYREILKIYYPKAQIKKVF